MAEVHLPLSRFLNLHVKAAQNLILVQDAFLGRHAIRSPFVIAISGSVAVGKSTFARVLQAILARWPDHPNVELVTTDGFLYPMPFSNSEDSCNARVFLKATTFTVL